MTTTERPTTEAGHAWNGVDGHDCVDCAPDSIWKCDIRAHGGLRRDEHGRYVSTPAENLRDAAKIVDDLMRCKCGRPSTWSDGCCIEHHARWQSAVISEPRDTPHLAADGDRWRGRPSGPRPAVTDDGLRSEPRSSGGWQGRPSGDDIDRAVAIVESSRLTHVHWAEWRRKGGTGDEMAGDLEHHEQAIRDYDHVLAVLRAVEPRPHVDDPTCWCRPTKTYTDPVTESEVWVHRYADD